MNKSFKYSDGTRSKISLDPAGRAMCRPRKTIVPPGPFDVVRVPVLLTLSVSWNASRTSEIPFREMEPTSKSST